MKDDDVIMLVKEQGDKVPLTVPVDVVISRGRRLRTRRRLPFAVGAASLVAMAAAGIVTLTPASQPSRQPAADARPRPSAQASIRLAAWTVTELSNGNVSVTIRQLLAPASLQRTLRADGVATSVTFQHLNAACLPYPAGAALLTRVFPTPYRRVDQLRRYSPHAPRLDPLTRDLTPPRPLPGGPAAMSANTTVIVIDPAALPRGAGVQLASSSHASLILIPRLVYTSPSCTGS